jgi:uncharacterized protein (TIGR00645 family)
MSESRRISDLAKTRVERVIEAGIFEARWLIAPIYLGLIAALAALVLNFLRDAFIQFSQLFSLSMQDTIMLALTMIDASLVGNLLLIVVFSGYENFVSKIDTADHEDRPEWMGVIDFAGVKIKVIASIVAISAIALLKAFIRLTEGGPVDKAALTWLLIIHGSFVTSGLLLALMDWVGAYTRKQRR